MLKLFQICVEGNTGSTGRIAEGLGVYTMDKGWDSYIAYGRFPRKSKSKLIRIGTGFSIFLHGLQTRIFDRHCLGSTFATKKLIKIIAGIKPDIIHLHHLHGYYINMVVLFDFLLKSGIPVIWTFHDCWSFTGHCVYFENIGCEKWKTECNRCPQKNEYPASLFFDRSKKNFYQKKQLFTSIENMTIVSVSYWLKGLVEQSFLGRKSNQVIYNGIDTNTFISQADKQAVRDKYKLGQKFLLLGVASPWDKRKGYSDFIKLSKIIDPDTIILLVGLNTSQIKQLPHNIIGIQKTEDLHELKNLYATADIFINLSVEESFGLTTAEALSCGTPAIVYDSTACIEILDANTGIVVKKGDINGIQISICEIRKHDKSNYSQACRDRVLKKFNKNDYLEKYFNLYNSVLT